MKKSIAKVWFVYLIYNIMNGKYYIGYTYDFTSRWKTHCSDAKNGSAYYFHRAIRKYGEEAFEYQILAVARTEKEVKPLEKLWILSLGAYKSDIGYNLTMGGDGVIANEETSRKRTEAMLKALLAKIAAMSPEEKEIRRTELVAIGKMGAKASKDRKWHQIFSEEEKAVVLKKMADSTKAQWKSMSEEELREYSKTQSSASKKSHSRPEVKEKDRNSAIEAWNRAGVREAHSNSLREFHRGVGKLIFITNGITTKRVKEDSEMPQGWVRGLAKKRIATDSPIPEEQHIKINALKEAA
jgi:group I intron endonuclease